MSMQPASKKSGSSPWYRVGLKVLFLVVFLAMIRGAASLGADGERYQHWAWAIIQHDLFSIHSEVITPWGVPFSHWPSGVGVIFSLPSVLVQRLLPFTGPLALEDVHRGCLHVGWICSILMLTGLWWVLFAMSNRSKVLAYFGMTLSLVGTPLAYYSITYSSETLTLLCLIMGWILLLYPCSWSAGPLLVVGCLTGLFMMIRQNQALYFVPFLVALIWNILKQVTPVLTRLWRLGCLGLPILISLLQIGISNRWMTGSWFRFPQQWGDENMSSMDFESPEIMATLFHPWHGLFVYHPLYIVGTLALVLTAIRSVRCRTESPGIVVYGSIAFGLLINLLFTAAFYTWWCGEYAFGSRGMAPCAVIFIPILVRAMAHAGNSARMWLWLSAALICAGWSFFLLRLGDTQLYMYASLIHEIWISIRQFAGNANGLNLLAVGIVMAVTALLSRRNRLGSLHTLCVMSANVMLLLVIIYLQEQMVAVRAGRGVLLIGGPGMVLLAALYIPCVARWITTEPQTVRVDDARLPLQLVKIVSLTTFALILVVFLPFAWKTQMDLASGKRAPRSDYQYEATFHIVDTLLSSREYENVPGFTEKKKRLREFIDEQARRARIESPVTDPEE